MRRIWTVISYSSNQNRSDVRNGRQVRPPRVVVWKMDGNMGREFLEKIRKMNWVLSESTTGKLSYTDLSRILSELIRANAYIIDAQGRVLGVGYTNAEDSSTYTDELGFEKIPEANNRNLLKLMETQVNLLGEELKAILGEDYPLTDKYHMFIPSVCGGKRLGTILLAKYGEAFTDEAVALGEYGATVVGLEIQRNDQLAMIHERNLRMAVDMAICSLSYSEHDALQKILAQMEEDEDVIVASKIAAKYKLTNSVIVSALKKMESAGILETKSLGMKGTYIKVVNPYLKKTLTA